MRVIQWALMGMCMPLAANAQWGGLPDGGFNEPVINCQGISVDYERGVAEPGQYVSWSPETCFIDRDTASWRIKPALPSGMEIDPETGRISGTPPPNFSEHIVREGHHIYGPASTRTVKVTHRNPITQRYETITTSFSYDFVDPHPLRFLRGYSDINHDEEMDGHHTRLAYVTGGEGGRRYRLNRPLPAGYSFNWLTGRITGRPDSPFDSCPGGNCRYRITVEDEIGREISTSFEIRNVETYASADHICYVMVHGHMEDPERLIEVVTEPNIGTHAEIGRDYWRSSSDHVEGIDNYTDPDDDTGMPGQLQTEYITADHVLERGDDQVYYVGYNTHVSVSSAAGLVADQIIDAMESTGGVPGEDGLRPIGGLRRLNSYIRTIGGDGCKGAERVVVVAHSMGGVVMDFILGNASPNRPFYDPRFARIADEIAGAVTMGSPHRGSKLADAACGEVDGIRGGFVDLSTECDPGYVDLMRANEIRQFIGALEAPLWAIGSHTGMCNVAGCSNNFFTRQNDGAVEYHSAFACDGSYGQNATSVCRNDRKVIDGLYNFDASEETHDSQRNAWHPEAKRIDIVDAIWSALPNPPSHSKTSSAKAIDLVFGAGKWLHAR